MQKWKFAQEQNNCKINFGLKPFWTLNKYVKTFWNIAKLENLTILVTISVTRLGDLLDFGQLLKAFGNN